jgi:hypothetical protein
MKRLLLACGLFACSAFGQMTTVTGTLTNPDSSLFSGTIHITWPSFSYAGQTIPANTIDVYVSGGALSVQLWPSDRVEPRLIYTVSGQYNTGVSYIDFWYVPYSGASVSITAAHMQSASGTGLPSGSSVNGSNLTLPGTLSVGGTTLNSVATSSQGSGYNYAAWGDSLTAGNEDGSGITYPNVLSPLLSNRQVLNFGVGGQTSTQIAVREGGVTTTATIVGGSIPGSGGVTVTFPTGYEPVTSNGPSGGTPGTISGVHGTVTLSGATYTFTRTTTGSVVTVASAPFVVDVPYNGWFTIIWAGRNNYNNQTQILSDIAGMVAALPNPKRLLILSDLNGDYPTGEYSGGTGYNQIISINTALATAYPSNYLDIRTLLVAQYNSGNAVDVIDHTNDVPPYTYRAQDVAGTVSAIGTTSTCSFTATMTSTTQLGNNFVMTVGSEYVLVSASTNTGGVTTVTGCTRGYASSTAATYSASTAFTAVDPIHLNGSLGYTFVANQVYAWIAANDPGIGTVANTPAGLISAFGNPPPIGNANPNSGVFTTVKSGTTNGYGLLAGAGTSAPNITPNNSDTGTGFGYGTGSHQTTFYSNGTAYGFFSNLGVAGNGLCMVDPTLVHYKCGFLSGDFSTWELTSNLAFSPDATYNIGYNSTTLRPKNGYFSGLLSAGGTITAGSTITAGASTTSAASLNVASGTAPTSPNSGDVWNAGGFQQRYDGTNTRQATEQLNNLRVALTSQTASIGSTTILTQGAAVGYYKINYYIYCHTAGSAGTVTLTIGWNVGVESPTFTTPTVSLATVGNDQYGSFPIRLSNATNLTYLTTVSGASGSPNYYVYIWIEQLQ